jgi:hypothetical protein
MVEQNKLSLLGDPRAAAFTRLLELSAAAEIEFESHPDFSSKYLLQGKDREAVRAVFGPRLIDYLNGLDHPLFVESGGGWLAAYRKALVQPEKIASFVEETGRLLEAVGVN